MDYFNKIISLGFLPYFFELYFKKMLDLGFSNALAYDFFIKTYKQNQEKGNITNVFDVIEKAKKTKIMKIQS